MATQSRIVAISGFMRSGKDSVATLLQEYGYSRIAFADPLRKLALDIDPTISLQGGPMEVLDYFYVDKYTDTDSAVRYSELIEEIGYEKAKEIPDFRRFLQRLGTEGIRNNFGYDAWVNLAVKNIESAPDDTRFVIPDCRFPNEAEAVKKLGGVVWRTVRPGYGGGEHPSEAEVLNITPDLILEAEDLFVLGTLVQEALEVPHDQRRIDLWAGAIYANA